MSTRHPLILLQSAGHPEREFASVYANHMEQIPWLFDETVFSRQSAWLPNGQLVSLYMKSINKSF